VRVTAEHTEMDVAPSQNVPVERCPRNLIIESTAVCNLKCVMCPHAIGAVVRPKHFPDEYVDKIAGFLQGAKSIQLHGIGEPLLSPSFWKLLALLRGGDCWSGMNTNLALLSEGMADRLVRSNLTEVNVSVDAATPETYWKIRGVDFGRLTANVKLLVARKRKQASPLSIAVNMTLMRENYLEVEQFLDLFLGEIGCSRAAVWPLNNFGSGHHSLYRHRTRFDFDYEQQGPWNFRADFNAVIDRAEEHARRNGYNFIGVKV
jgi:MoaA/NifB/PqqE/SkfB family radical SAM enzyme